MSSDELSLPQDPGPVPASLRDAYTDAVESRRATSPGSHPGPTELDRLLDEGQDDQARLAVVDQLLASRTGVETLAHLVAARVATSGQDTAESGAAPVAAIAPPEVPARVSGARLSATLKPILLAASLMLVAGTSWYVFTLPPREDDVRALGSAVELHAAPPASAANVVRLAWKPLRTTSRYRVEILDVNDDPVFISETSDTTTAVPAGALKPGTYRWWVRSRATDGTEIRSRVEKLSIQ